MTYVFHGMHLISISPLMFHLKIGVCMVRY